MKYNILLYITIITIFSANIYGQSSKIAKADRKYDNFAYIDAIKTYERVAEKGYKSVEIFEKLGNSYYFNGQLANASKWYGELFAMKADVKPEYFFRYAQSLRAIGENKQADLIMQKFVELSTDDSRADFYDKNRDYLAEIKNNTGRYDVDSTSINSKYSDYGSAFFNNKLIFASARDTGSIGQRKHTWTNQYFTNLYVADLDEKLNPSNPVKFEGKINSKFNESTPIFTKDGKTIYFTRNNYLDGKKGKNANDVTLIKIYKATLVDNEWSNITEMPFNSDSYSTAHPALSKDEKTLYFASDMPGTIGLSDLFKVSIGENGTYGKPENLGVKINTPGRETFPFLNDENEIYFASDGHPGVGGLDVFVTKINDDNTYGDVQNVGADINSPKDDFAYIIDSKSRRGFFTSSRDGGKGYDDIYKFIENKPLTCEQELYGQITDVDSKEPLPNAKVSLFDKKFTEIATTTADANGNYTFKVDCGKTYYVRAEQPDYNTREEKVTTSTEKGRTELNIALEKITCKVSVGDDLGHCFGIKLIYFDLDKSDIRPQAELDLEKILDVLRQYPNMKLDIRSHTDSRGSFKYNESLSDRRAKATIKWLVQNGVTADRLIGKGYGEYQLVNKCVDGVSCTEEEHQFNRRSEFIITDL
ncbi:OmpA family protein [Flavobacterium algicola]|uniref:OmpA family protein n=1 Tax=Flavobacterium algicola TaxID=556529 RepID=UPI001EFEE2D9|nr:OmpA family protein [Flavobacterium algicola]MCG9792643.1 OmpA family protein [Flavobacterium algicola]